MRQLQKPLNCNNCLRYTFIDNQYRKKKILGSCDKIKFKTFIFDKQNQSDKTLEEQRQVGQIENEQQKDQTYLFIKVKNAQNSVAISLCGPDLNELTQVKECLQKLIKIGYHYNIERELIIQDKLLLKNMQKQKQKVELLTCGTFLEYLFMKRKNLDFLNNDQIEFSEIKFINADISEIYDIKEASYNALVQYLNEHQENFNDKKIRQFCSHCKIIRRGSVQYYSKQNKIQYNLFNRSDISLGAYLMLKFVNKDVLCSSCKKAQKYHWKILYAGSNCYIKISLQVQKKPNFILKSSFISKTFEQFISSDTAKQDVKSNQQNEIILQPEISQQNNFEQKTLAQLIKDNTKFNQKDSKLIIFTFLLCDDCEQKLTDQFELTEQYLEYSFYRFIQGLFLTVSDFAKQNKKSVHSYVGSSDKCKHLNISRVFQYENTKILFYCNIYQSYQVEFFQFKSEKVQDEIQKCNEQTVQTRIKKLVDSINEITEIIKNIVRKIGMTVLTTPSKLDSIRGTNQKNEQGYKLFLNRLTKLQNESIQCIQSESYSDYLKFENESKKWFLKFSEIKKIVKQKIRQKSSDQTLKNFVDLFRSTTNMQKNNFPEITPKRDHQGKSDDRIMLSMLLPVDKTKKIKSQKELDCDQQTKKEEKISNLKKFLGTPTNQQRQIESAKELQKAKQRGSLRPETTQFQTANNFREQTSLQRIVEKNNDNPSVELESDNELTKEELQNFLNSCKDFSLKKYWPHYSLNFKEKIEQKPFISFIPIKDENDVALLGYALNTLTYNTSVYEKAGIIIYETKIQGFHLQEYSAFPNPNDKEQIEFVKNNLLHARSTQQNSLNIVIQIENIPTENIPMEAEIITKSTTLTDGFLNSIQEIEEESKEQQLLKDQSGQFQINIQNNKFEEFKEFKQNKNKFSAEIIIYHPKEFECLRMINNISIQQFIKCLASCANWDSQGGKSGNQLNIFKTIGASFHKSLDNLMVIKEVKESEFFMFYNFAPAYFEHQFKHIYENQPSVLNKIYGMFEYRLKNSNIYYIAMENLFFGMDGELIVYDLKGSQAKRWQRKVGKTLLDTNFTIDQNGEPLPVMSEDYRYIIRSLYLDSEFLEKCEVVDYSLLLIMDREKLKIKMGLIDYLQQYTLKKQLENGFKKVINLGQDPTIIRPEHYKTRFQDAMQKYFMETRLTF